MNSGIPCISYKRKYRWASAFTETIDSQCTGELHAGSCFTKSNNIANNPKE